MIASRRLAWTAGGLGTAMLLAAGVLAVLAAGQEAQGPVAALNLIDIGAVLWVGALLAARKPDNAVGPVLLIAGLLGSLLLFLTHYANYALLARSGIPGGVWALVGQQPLWPAVYFLVFVLLPLLFPDGRLLSRRWRPLVVGLAVLTLVPIVVGPLLAQQDIGSRTVPNPIGVLDPAVFAPLQPAWTLLFSLGILAALASLVLRYRRSEADRRQQIRLVAAAVGATVVVFALQQLSQVLLPAAALPWWLFTIPLAGVPASIGIAVLRHRLFDIDLAIRRSLVFGILWLAIVLVYIGLSAALGLAAGQRLSVQAAVVVTIGATLLFQPARTRLERLADRLAYGRRAEAYELLRDFGAATEQTLDVTEIGPRIAAAARTGMSARWARVAVADGSVLGLSGQPDGPPALVVPILRGEDAIGAIECGPKLDGGYTRRDGEVLSTLARQAALAIHNAGLTVELVRRVAAMDEQTRELAASRSRIVQVQEAERRRIERDLHDGVQQQLIALAAGVRLARNRLKDDPEAADVALGEVQAQALQAGRDLRELVRGIRPPVLEDAGLVAAIEAAVPRLPLQVTLDVDEGATTQRYRAELEGAAYFVVCEALANVMKHAGVGEATVRVRRSSGHLAVAVADAGCGFDGARAQGSGLAGLRDRVAAVGGELTVDSRPGGGTTVEARLPVGNDD